MNGLRGRAASAEEIMRPRRSLGRFWAAPDFTISRPAALGCLLTNIRTWDP